MTAAKLLNRQTASLKFSQTNSSEFYIFQFPLAFNFSWQQFIAPLYSCAYSRDYRLSLEHVSVGHISVGHKNLP